MDDTWYVSTLSISHRWYCSISVCVSAAPVCPFLLWHLQQSLLLLPLAGMLKWLELPFLSFFLSSAFLCAGLKKSCWDMGGFLRLFLPGLSCADPRGMLRSVSCPSCPWHPVLSLHPTVSLTTLQSVFLLPGTTLHPFIKDTTWEGLAYEGEPGWDAPGLLLAESPNLRGGAGANWNQLSFSNAVLASQALGGRSWVCCEGLGL